MFQAPWLVVFETYRGLNCSDLTGDFATRMGASMAIHSGAGEGRAAGRGICMKRILKPKGFCMRRRCRGKPAMAFNERALEGRSFRRIPYFIARLQMM